MELTVSEAEAFDMVKSGKLDALVTIDGFGDPEKAVPVCKVGSSDYYFAVTNTRADIFEELEYALNRINDENRYFNQQMHEKYLKTTGANLYLTESEKTWLSSHGTIKVGYMRDYLPFCAKDTETKQLTGALKEYLEYAAGVIQNADLRFDAVAFDSIGDAIDALLAQELEGVRAGGVGVALDRDLAVHAHVAVELEGVEDVGDPVGPVEAGRAAAEVEAVHLISLDRGRRFLQMGKQRPLILRHQMLAAGERIEVAVAALARAEGDMDIDSQPFRHRSKLQILCVVNVASASSRAERGILTKDPSPLCPSG